MRVIIHWVKFNYFVKVKLLNFECHSLMDLLNILLKKASIIACTQIKLKMSQTRLRCKW